MLECTDGDLDQPAFLSQSELDRKMNRLAERVIDMLMEHPSAIACDAVNVAHAYLVLYAGYSSREAVKHFRGSLGSQARKRQLRELGVRLNDASRAKELGSE